MLSEPFAIRALAGTTRVRRRTPGRLLSRVTELDTHAADWRSRPFRAHAVHRRPMFEKDALANSLLNAAAAFIDT
ncbi:MAG: hypothetical protein DMG01_07445 [Acidobacteria bacterium]|nr:MAG: hypothetical protein DMG01_07445 [Acidobacteriota bacterium]